MILGIGVQAPLTQAGAKGGQEEEGAYGGEKEEGKTLLRIVRQSRVYLYWV